MLESLLLCLKSEGNIKYRRKVRSKNQAGNRQIQAGVGKQGEQLRSAVERPIGNSGIGVKNNAWTMSGSALHANYNDTVEQFLSYCTFFFLSANVSSSSQIMIESVFLLEQQVHNLTLAGIILLLKPLSLGLEKHVRILLRSITRPINFYERTA